MDTLVQFGGTLKAMGEGRFRGPLVLFTDGTKADLTGEYFPPDCDFWTRFPTDRPLIYHHGLDKGMGLKRLGMKSGTVELDMEESGVWMQGQLDLADSYEEKIYRLIEKGKLGSSSGSAPHLIAKAKMGDAYAITSWPLVEASLTPQPCQPLNRIVPLKALPELLGIESEDPDPPVSFDDQLSDALCSVTACRERAERIQHYRIKSGRKLSSARLQKLTDIRDALDALLNEAAPREEEDDSTVNFAALFARQQQIRRELLGV